MANRGIFLKQTAGRPCIDHDMRMTLIRNAPREAFKKVQLLPELPLLAGFPAGGAGARVVTLDPLAVCGGPTREIRSGANSPAFPTNFRAPQP